MGRGGLSVVLEQLSPNDQQSVPIAMHCHSRPTDVVACYTQKEWVPGILQKIVVAYLGEISVHRVDQLHRPLSRTGRIRRPGVRWFPQMLQSAKDHLPHRDFITATFPCCAHNEACSDA